MEAVLRALSFPNYGILIFNPVFIAIIYFVLIVVLYYLIYKDSNFLVNIKHIINSLRSKFKNIPLTKNV